VSAPASPPPSASATPEPGRGKRLAFAAVAALLVWLACDALGYVALLELRKRINIFAGVSTPSDEVLAGFRDKYFHPVWGWDVAKDERGPQGSRGPRAYDGPVMLKVFGDSFTYGVGVPAEETYAAQIEAEAGWSAPNFGVAAYGPDQALLKYRDTPLPSRYAVLAILDENVGRVVTVWWKFYDRGSGSFGGTKPRFDLSSGRAVLVENPIQRAEDLPRLQDPAWIRLLERFDYWSAYYDRIHAPREPRFPATFTLLGHLDFFLRNAWIVARNRFAPSYESLTDRRKFYHLYEPGSVGLATLEHVVLAFAETARARGETPIVLIFPVRFTLELVERFGRKPYESFSSWLAASGVASIDFGDLFLHEDYAGYYIADDPRGDPHFSKAGHARVARELVALLRRLEAERAAAADAATPPG
jgi:hypothetical protein